MVVLCLAVALGGCTGVGAPASKSVVASKPVGAAKPRPTPAAPAKFTLPSLDEFNDMSAPDVVAALGPPDFRRVEPPAEVWQYRGAECVIDLFLYRIRGELRVENEDSRNRDPAGSNQRCRNGREVLRGRMAANLP
ncbi:MAG: hypothetical protein ACREFD_12210 [Stellaceae bacterium]